RQAQQQTKEQEMGLISWIANYWTVLIWAIPILAGCAVLRFYLGSKLSWPALLAGLSFIIFMLGRKIERDNYKKYVQGINEKRKKAYEEIDNRGTDADDVIDRLRNGRF